MPWWSVFQHNLENDFNLPEWTLRLSKSELPPYVFRVVAYDPKGIVEPDARLLLGEAQRRGESIDLSDIAANHHVRGVAIVERVTDSKTLEEVISRLEDALKKEYEEAGWDKLFESA